MKIRLDFVTNSSSSSFTCVALYSEDLYNYLQKLIAEKKYSEQPRWTKNNAWIRPETELYNGYIWDELKFDQRCYKVQTTEQYGNVGGGWTFRYICSFFENLSSDETETIKELVFAVYDSGDYQTHTYEDMTDGFVGFDFKGFIPKSDLKGDIDSEKAKELIREIDKMSVDPETTDLSMKSIAMSFYSIDGSGIYDPEADRYKHIDKSFLNKVKLEWIDRDSPEYYIEEQLAEEKRRVWADYLQGRYDEALDDIGAIPLGNISSRSDCAVVYDSIDGAVNKYSLDYYLMEKYNMSRFDPGFDHMLRGNLDQIKENCFIDYLQKTISSIKEANTNRGDDKPPVAVIWESQMHDYLMKHTSLGNVTPIPVFGPNGTQRLKVPERYKKTVDSATTEMITRWPSRVINPKTKTYEKINKELSRCYESIGYESLEAFFDAYGFSVKQEETRTDTNKEGDFEYTKTKKNEVTLVKYLGKDSKVVLPEIIGGGTLKIIGVEAFISNNSIEEVIIPESVDTIRTKAFAFCRNLRKIQLSDSISKLVAETFDGCEKLEEINIPDKVEQLPSGLFRDCPIKVLHIGRSLASFNKNDFYKGELIDGNIMHGYAKTSAMESITVDPKNKSLKSIDSMILSYDGKIVFAMLGASPFCRIPDGVEIIADYAFSRQIKLEEVILPESLRLIGNRAFEFTKLEAVSFPRNLKKIGSFAFNLCRSLTSVYFAEGVEEIYNYAFSSSGLRAVVLPYSLKKLGRQVFDYWAMESIEPEEWKQKIQAFGYYASGLEDNLDTQEAIAELIKARAQSAAASQMENRIGVGMLASMMAYLQSDAVKNVDLAERLKLERLVISKEMESILGTDLKTILSFYKDNATEQLRNCIKYLKTEADKDTIIEYCRRIREMFPAEEAEKLLESVKGIIGEEA